MSGVELLPLPEKSVIDRHLPTGIRVYGYTSDDMRAYARACIALAQRPASVEAEKVFHAVSAYVSPADRSYFRKALEQAITAPPEAK